MPEAGVLDVAVAVIERNGQYLISQRLSNDSFGGRWEFPGGKLLPGEAVEACLVREIQEELGLAIAVKEKLMVIDHRYPQRALRLHCFLCGVISGEPQTIECAAWRWVAPGELKGYTFPPASGPIIQRICDDSRWSLPSRPIPDQVGDDIEGGNDDKGCAR